MNEKGFATLLNLCLILVIALIVKGIQESEMNHVYATKDFQTEFDLQNAADSGIYMAAEKVRRELQTDENYLPVNKNPHLNGSRRQGQIEIISEPKSYSEDSIAIKVLGERVVLKSYEVNYEDKNTLNPSDADKTAYIFFSTAEMDSERLGRKIYRRAVAYVLSEDDDWKIHFMTSPTYK